jgi:hypothetical protein
LSAVVQINAGGTESCDWAEMLAHVHDEKIAKIKELNSRKRSCRYKTVTLEFEGDYSGYLKGENGVHRLVRISPLTVMPSVIPLLHPFMCIQIVSKFHYKYRDYDFAIQWCGTKCK